MKHEPVSPPDCRIASVLVVDDHPLYAEALCSALRHVFDDPHIETVTCLQDALDTLRPGFSPDLVMLDLKLPDVTGICGLLRLRDQMPDTPILVNSSLASDDIVAAVKSAGAAGFLCKDAPIQTLKLALSEIRLGHKFFETVPRNGSVSGQRSLDVREISQRILQLTPQQSRVMRLICAGKQNKQIAYEMNLAEATVKAHITVLLRRLGVQNRTQAAVLVESVGLNFSGDYAESEAESSVGR
ncbi:LuxR family transcriptional regulator [Roseivivax halodurans JCM 10272]|uniref:LuxR family transcriptional regulator n=1 Tax=Roseivivax halodurans JCM 10272 TaxID=1449350 RepID=X7EE61_9RHOB|nr:response regulator transcription factor [Roseivivax halodurans]ETX14232.1 LuxR family transcriptional regulator [Roseivivax halodurans JCM 10272]